MVLNAILNALKSGLQRDPQRIEERSSTRSLNASKSDLQRVEGGVPFFLLRLRMRRNHNGLACRNYLRGLLLRANRGSRRNAEWLQRASEEPERRRSDESGNGKPFPPLTGHWSGRNRAPPSVLIGESGWGGIRHTSRKIEQLQYLIGKRQGCRRERCWAPQSRPRLPYRCLRGRGVYP